MQTDRQTLERDTEAEREGIIYALRSVTLQWHAERSVVQG